MRSDFDIGILTFVPDLWENCWMSRHHIMSRLSRYYKVLWVSPPLYWREAIRFRTAEISTRGVKKVSPSFWTYAPERYLPFTYRFGKLAQFFQEARVRKIKSLLAEMGINRLALYIWRPEYSCNLGVFNEDLVCYHIDDEYTFSNIDLPVTEEERRLIENSDISFIHSRTLLEKKGRFSPLTYYVPNGVDFDYYRKIVEQDRNLHELDSIPGPRIGYIGYIKNQLDLDLLLKLSRKRKDWSFVLVGPVAASHTGITTKVELLKRENNVYFLGEKKPEDLPNYIKEMDVCLMIYRYTPYTKYIYPLKLHEYLACGKPVVSTCLDNLKEFSRVIDFADGLEDWIEKIQRALDNLDPMREQQRISVSKENSWDQRIETIRSAIQDKLCQKEVHIE